MHFKFEIMKREELEAEKTALIEELGVQLENDNFPPVAARIFATLILNGKKGITFDQLVCDLKAGKSTVSSHLEHLQVANKVKYFTKPGDRKRYFTINDGLMLNMIEEMIAKWESEKRIHEKVLDYKKKHNKFCSKTQEYQFELEFQQDFLTFLHEASAAIQKLKLKVNQSNT